MKSTTAACNEVYLAMQQFRLTVNYVSRDTRLRNGLNILFQFSSQISFPLVSCFLHHHCQSYMPTNLLVEIFLFTCMHNVYWQYVMPSQKTHFSFISIFNNALMCMKELSSGLISCYIHDNIISYKVDWHQIYCLNLM